MNGGLWCAGFLREAPRTDIAGPWFSIFNIFPGSLGSSKSNLPGSWAHSENLPAVTVGTARPRSSPATWRPATLLPAFLPKDGTDPHEDVTAKTLT